jgi:hypothetical protein
MNLAVAESVCERLHQNAELCNKKPAEPEKMKSKESMSEHMHQS